MLISKNGKSTRFTYNGCKRIVFGEYGTNAKITINGNEAGLETEVEEKDDIKLQFAQNGKDAAPKLCDNIKNINSISIYIDDEIMNIEPIMLVNGKFENLEYIIKNGDSVEVFLPSKVKDIKKYIIKEDINLLQNGVILNEEYEVLEGEKNFKEHITEVEESITVNEEKTSDMEKKELSKDFEQYIVHEVNSDEGHIEEVLDDNKVQEDITSSNEKSDLQAEKKSSIGEVEQLEKDLQIKIDEPKIYKEEISTITVTINGTKTVMEGKKDYLIVDIFNYIDFDLTVPKGNIVIKINGEKCAYTDAIKNGDIIEIYWEN